jgi:type III secretion protein V
MAIIPGLQKIHFFMLAGLTGSLAYGLFRAQKVQTATIEKSETVAANVQDPALSLTVPLMLQVSTDLTSFVDRDTPNGKMFYEQFMTLRTTLYYDLGVIFPAIQIRGNTGEAGSYSIWLNEVPILSGQIRQDAVLVNDGLEAISVYGFKGENTRNPATGKRAAWIPREDAERARSVGLQVWDTQHILLLHLTQYLRKNAKEFIGIQEVQGMISALKQHYPTLVEETVPKPVSLQTLTEILRRLVEEEVSIRDLKTILQSLCEWARVEHEVLALTEYVRTGLRTKICYQMSRGRPLLFVYRLDPEFEEMFRNSVRQSAGGPYLAMDPALSQQVLAAARSHIGDLPPGAQRPVIVTDGDIRRFVKRMLDFALPEITVLSYDQLASQINLQPLGMISPKVHEQIAAS